MNVAFLKTGLLPGRVLKEEAALVISNGQAYVSHDQAALSTPTDIEDCVIPARRFLDALARTPDAEIKVTPKRVTITNAQKSFRFQRMEPQLPSHLPTPCVWEVPPDLRETFAGLVLFCSDEVSRPWTLGVREAEGRFFSTNGLVLAASVNQYKTPFWGDTLPNMFAQIMGSFPVTHAGGDEDEFIAWLDDGSSARVTALANSMPAKVHQLFANVYKDPTWAIPGTWRDTFVDAARSMDSKVTIDAERMVADLLGDEVIGYADSNAAGAIFHPKLLARVVAVATHIDFSAYPDPVSFKGDLICGLVAGMK